MWWSLRLAKLFCFCYILNLFSFVRYQQAQTTLLPVWRILPLSCVALLLLSYGSRLLDHMFCFQIGLAGRNQQPRERPTSLRIKTVRVQDILLYVVLCYAALFVIAKDITTLFVFSYLFFFPFSQCTYYATTFKVHHDMYNLEEWIYFYNLIWWKHLRS